MKRHVLGIDGGGTKTQALIVDEEGHVRGWGMEGPSNYDDVGMEKAGVVASFTGEMLAGEPAIVTGDVGDCARANDLALTIDHQPGIYNLGWGRPTSINESFFAPAKATGYSQPIQHGPARVGESGEGIRLDSHPDPRTGFGEDFETRRWRCDCVQVLC